MKNARKNNDGQISCQSYEVFVAGIPAAVDASLVSIYFNELGPITNLELLKIGKVSQRNKLPKTFYRLTTESRQLFSLLVDQPGPIFKGRRLFCQAFKIGDDLALHSADINARRIVVKQVPLSAIDNQIKAALVQAGGPIETLYQYKSNVDTNTDYDKSFKTYSATFKLGNNVTQLIENGSLVLSSGVTILIEGFVYKKRGAIEPNAHKLPVSVTTTKKNLGKQAYFESSTETTKKIYEPYFFPDIDQEKKASYESHKMPKKELPPKLAPDSENWHRKGLKPTSTKYHLHDKAPKYNHSSVFGRQLQSNLRFNFLL